jgi:hypothetical protein
MQSARFIDPAISKRSSTNKIPPYTNENKLFTKRFDIVTSTTNKITFFIRLFSSI